MDQSASEHDKDRGEISGLTPDMRLEASDIRSAPLRGQSEPVPAQRNPSRLTLAVSLISGLVGLAALAACVFVYADTRQEIVRLSTELAELRVSLDLYAMGSRTADTGTTSGTALTDLANRLAILEQNWRDTPAAAATPPAPAQAASSASGEDCLPAGMRLLVAVGDSYPVCGMAATIDIAVVDNGYVGLADGTVIPSGGVMPLAGTSCTIGVTSSGDEGVTGYGEIRVNC